MLRDIILLSGPVACGKSTLAADLEKRFDVTRIRTREIIKVLKPRVRNERASLQRAGDRLDSETNGEWISSYVQKEILTLKPNHGILIDSVRITKQVEAFRRAFGRRVIHIHLTASDAELKRRYQLRIEKQSSGIEEALSFEDLRRNKTERQVYLLANDADIIIDTEKCRPEDIVIRAASHLGFYGRAYERLVDVLVGGGYGSEGKGQIVSYLAAEYDVLMRVGGPNAGHKVWMEPTPYAFHSLPSGALHSDAKLLIGPGAVINVDILRREINECEVDIDRLAVDPQCMVIEQEDIDWERKTIEHSIGSTAQGVGHATARRILGRHGGVRLAKDIADLKPYVRSTREALDWAFYRGERVLLEGTQGTGLSLYHGEYPYVTSRDSSVGGCLAEAGIAPGRVRKIVLVTRTYPIRVQNPEGGTSGNMGIEIDWDTVAARSGLDPAELRHYEITTTTKRSRRVAEFNWELLRTAASINAPTDIALTFVDYLNKANQNAQRFDQLDIPTIRFIEEVERVAAAPVSLISNGFGPRTVMDRRSW